MISSDRFAQIVCSWLHLAFSSSSAASFVWGRVLHLKDFNRIKKFGYYRS